LPPAALPKSASRPRLGHAACCLAAFAALTALSPAPASAAGSLQPTRAGLVRQSLGARAHQFSYLADDTQVHEFVRRGLLVPVRSNADVYVHKGVRHAVARPEVKLFVERLGRQYREACGERLVVTSLLRPKSRQPNNSHPLSVHPTGMALDLRVSDSSRCRGWLERTLVDLETRGVLEAARERRPPHYHVVIFPKSYAAYVGAGGSTAAVTQVAAAPAAPAAKATANPRYRVRSGDNLWTIARRHSVTVAAIKRYNGLRSTQLKPGQTITIPTR
jgi:LysM repeat protein